MHKEITLRLPPEIAFNKDELIAYLKSELKLSDSDALSVRLLKRSIDARQKNVIVNVTLELWVNEPGKPISEYQFEYKDISKAAEVTIIGAGPAGMFAALRLIELGFKPVILERGKDVQARRRDLANINRKHIVNPDSNYCFGEGGAGTYSDGKLYTRSTKRGDVRRILEIMYQHGAREEILYDAHPHIGTNKLPKLVQTLRERILECGGEIHFNSRITDLELDGNRIRSVATASGERYTGEAVLLATGHSARDIFYLLDNKGIYIEAKPFAMGVRVEHPQELIDKIQYKGKTHGGYLPAAAYALATQTFYENIQRGVFSFCMCPGGFIVPAATSPGEVVVNGMSPSKRDSPFANSGIVTSIELEDIRAYAAHGTLGGLEMQKQLEEDACRWGGDTQTAPAQRLEDFVKGLESATLPECSYIPGLKPVPLHQLLSENISERLRYAFKKFGEVMKGYLTNDAVVVGVESRTSSPVRIPRDKVSLHHPQIENLYPCGEGAGYAGGIVSAAMDGERCAEALASITVKR